MAVYKSTRCYPFLSSVDIRTTLTNGKNSLPAQYLKCKVDTSNKKITGYKIRILDESNNQIFPVSGSGAEISPISELQTGNMQDLYQSNGDNSGLNGTYLYIPFFQTNAEPKTKSYNAVYYVPTFAVDYIILDLNAVTEFESATGITPIYRGAICADNWTADGEGVLTYNWADATQAERDQNKIKIDGDVILEGQIIFVANGVNSGFYTVVRKSVDMGGSSIYQTELHHLTNWGTGSGNVLVVKKGKDLHNSTWNITGTYYDSSKFNKPLFVAYKSGSNTPVRVEGLELGGRLYKWEITLYQGEGYVSQGNFNYIDYTDLDNQAFDMVVTSGTVLGSNSSRIQIASNQAFDGGGNPTEAILPSSNNGPLVLQGKYFSFGNDSDTGIFDNERIYVKTYDASYGHVYPIEGDLDANRVEQNSKIQFFKYTNNLDSIKETDIVTYGIGYKIPFKLYIYSNSSFTLYSHTGSDSGAYIHDYYTSTNVNTRRYGVAISSLPDVVLNNLVGQKVLFTGQISQASGTAVSDPCQNGVYEFYEIAGAPSGIIFLKRAASYDTWANYLGKIICCRNYFEGRTATPSVSNLESLAGSGSFELWDPDNVVAGDSGLYFTKELPILLFDSKIDPDYYFDLKTFDDIRENDRVPKSTKIDGVVIQPGDIVLRCEVGEPDGLLFKVVDVGSAYEYQPFEPFTYDGGYYYYIAKGKKYGKRVFLRGDDTEPNWDLYTAKILKNANNYTYISPFIGVSEDMKIKLSQGKTILDGETQTNTSWIKIVGVDSTLFCICHYPLTPVLESETNSEVGTPWKYEIRTFFKASDENPFYAYEMPYLNLYKNNTEYTTLSNYPLQEYFITDSLSNVLPYDVTSESDTIQSFWLRSYSDTSAVTGNSVKLSADYIQFDGLSWESYRWVLFNSAGETLQDTGKKYDKTIAVIFYGLSNDGSKTGGIYYAMLEVEDEKRNKVVYVIKLAVEIGEVAVSSLIFNAEFDCNIHAIKLDFSENRVLMSSFESDNKNIASSSFADARGSFSSDRGATINPKDSVFYDYTYGSNITATDGELPLASLSLEGKYGLPYYTTFEQGRTEEAASADRGLLLLTQPEDTNDEGQLYFETDVVLDNDFCGTILTLDVEGVSDSGVEDPSIAAETGEEFDKDGYLTIRLYTNENFSFDSSTHTYSVSSLRDQFLVSFMADGDERYLVYSTLGDLKLFNKSDVQNSLYHMQPASLVTDLCKDSSYEYLEHNIIYDPSYNYSGKKDIYIKQDSDGEYFAGGTVFFGNLCLRADTGHCYPFWDENRPYLYEAEQNSSIGNYFINQTAFQTTSGDRAAQTNNSILCWPNATNEGNYVWAEEDFNFSRYTEKGLDAPVKWDDVRAFDQNVKKMVSMKRHYGISNYSYHITCILTKIKNLYNRLKDKEISLLIEASVSDSAHTLIKIYDTSSREEYGSFDVEKQAV